MVNTPKENGVIITPFDGEPREEGFESEDTAEDTADITRLIRILRQLPENDNYLGRPIGELIENLEKRTDIGLKILEQHRRIKKGEES